MKWFNILLILGLITATSCSDSGVFSSNTSFTNGWSLNDTVQIDLPELDSLTAYDLLLNVRNTNEYPFNNLFLIVEMQFPKGKHLVDTLEYRMANPDGTWIGTGVGSVKDNLLWYKKGVRFFEPGTYTLKIVHAVRNNGNVNGVQRLDGIIDVGLRVETHKNAVE